MTEAEKRLLDQFRMHERHPAVDYEELPPELKDYIISLEGEVYDNRQNNLALGVLFISGIGVYTLYRSFNVRDSIDLWVGICFSIFPWIYYIYRHRKNADEFMPEERPNKNFNDAVQEAWDLNYLSQTRQRK